MVKKVDWRGTEKNLLKKKLETQTKLVDLFLLFETS